MVRETDIINSILALKADAEVTVRDNNVDTIEWSDGNPTNITKEQILAKQVELQTDYDAQDYARKRIAEYPTIQEAVHAILDDDLENLQIKRTAIKEKYPK